MKIKSCITPDGYRFNLLLSEREAGALHELLLHVGGCPLNSPRGMVDKIVSNLAALGVKPIQEVIDAGEDISFNKWS